MSNMKSILSAYAMFAMMSDISMQKEETTSKDILEDMNERRRLKVEKNKVKIMERKGLTKFYYGRNSHWAMSQKVSDKKAFAKGWIM